MTYILPSITPEEISFISKYIYDLSGIMLGQKKGYLLENRFTVIMEEFDCSTFTELYYLSKSNSNKIIEKRLIDAISTHETSFFRDNAPFELLKQKLIPNLLDCRRKQIRMVENVPLPLSIWSTACSTGQELYSIAIILKELLGKFDQYSIKLLGSDISEKAIQKATSGVYNDFEINRGLNTGRVQRFFKKNGNNWAARDEIKNLIRFKKVNLAKPFHSLGKFDIILCRNVAVYFSKPDRIKFFKDIAKCMHRDSCLFVGSTESLNELSDLYRSTQHMGASYYQLRSQDT